MRGMNDPEKKPPPNRKRWIRPVLVAAGLCLIAGYYAAKPGWRTGSYSPRCETHADCSGGCRPSHVGQCFGAPDGAQRCTCVPKEMVLAWRAEHRASRRAALLRTPDPGCELDIPGGLERGLTDEFLDGDEPVAWFCRNINGGDGGGIP